MLFTYPGNEALAKKLAAKGGYEQGALTIRRFPDGESMIRLGSEVRGRDVFLLCSLGQPDDKAMALMFFAETARELGAKGVHLIAPYLGYMRQDKRFQDGEAVSSGLFASFLSRYFDSLLTVDPHLHRRKSMDEIYTIPVRVVHASEAIARWVDDYVPQPVLVGPDEESWQWVAAVAAKAGVPYTVLAKTRYGDKIVDISAPELDGHKDRTPVIIDDIISTARTMTQTVVRLRKAGMKPPVCIGIHAVFAGDAYDTLKASGAARIVTCNTVPHHTNAINISDQLVFENPVKLFSPSAVGRA